LICVDCVDDDDKVGGGCGDVCGGGVFV